MGLWAPRRQNKPLVRGVSIGKGLEGLFQNSFRPDGLVMLNARQYAGAARALTMKHLNRRNTQILHCIQDDISPYRF